MKYKNETIVFIEYFKDIPCLIYTDCGQYEFEKYADDTWLMFEQVSWGGPSNKTIKYQGIPVNPQNHKIWIEDGYTCNIPEGVEKLNKPIMLLIYGRNYHNNPFIAGTEVDEIYYCEKCGKNYNQDGCPEHGFEYD